MIRLVVREALASVRSQPVLSAVTVVMVLGMVLAVMLTTGRTVGAEQRVLSTIDSEGTRTIVVRAEAEAGLTSSAIDRMSGIEGIEWLGGFSAAVDATNSAVPEGKTTPVRSLYGGDLERLGVPPASPIPGGLAWASPQALQDLGMPDASGGVTATSGTSYGVAGELDVPDFLEELEPLVIVPQPDARGDERLSTIVVIARTPELVPAVGDAVMSVAAADDPSKLSLQTSENLAALRSLVGGQLGSFSRGLVLALLAVTGGLLAVLLFSLVMMRRKDFGRRRALGASRGLIVGLILAQTAVLAGVGLMLGVGVSVAVLLATADPLPGVSFTLALCVLTLATALLSAILPAVVASRREPIRELRVP